MGLFRSITDLIDRASNNARTPAETWSRWDGVDGMQANDRKARAVGGKLTAFSMDRQHYTGEYAGSNKQKYRTSLLRCTCPDFAKRGVPCKHMYHLAYNLGLNIHLDYMEMMRGALDNPGYDGVEEGRLTDFWAYRNTFEIMLCEKIIGMIWQAGGRMSQVDLKERLNNGELNFYDYVISMLTESNRLQREKEKGRVIFSIKNGGHPFQSDRQ